MLYEKQFLSAVYRDGTLMGIDRDSGGYPYKTNERFHQFKDEKEQKRYTDMFPEVSPCKCKLTIVIEE